MKWLARLSAAGCGYFVASLAAAHVLRSDYDPVAETVSQYAVGPYGFLITTAFFALGPGVLALALGLSRGVRPTPRIGAALLGVAGVGVLVVGAFPVDRAPSAMPVSEAVHDAAYVASFLATCLAMIILTAHFKRDARWRSVLCSSLILSLAAAATLVAFLVASDTPWTGVVQRFGIAAIVSWLLLVSARLTSVAR